MGGVLCGEGGEGELCVCVCDGVDEGGEMAKLKLRGRGGGFGGGV